MIQSPNSHPFAFSAIQSHANRLYTPATSTAAAANVQAAGPWIDQPNSHAKTTASTTVYPSTSAAPAALLSVRPTRPMMKKVAHGSNSTTPSQLTIRPVAVTSAERVSGSICHHEIPAAITARATSPLSTLPPALLRKSMPEWHCTDNVAAGAL